MTSRTAVHDRDNLRTCFHVLKASRPRPPALLAALTAGVCVMIFIALAIAVEAQLAPGADRRAELVVHADVSGHLYGFMAALSFVGESGSIAVLAFACAVFYLRSGGRWTAAVVVASPTGAGILDTVLKDVFHRHRPHLWPHAAIINSFSFPSGHATISSAFLAGLTYVAWKLYGAPTGRLTALACGALATGIRVLARLSGGPLAVGCAGRIRRRPGLGVSTDRHFRISPKARWRSQCRNATKRPETPRETTGMVRYVGRAMPPRPDRVARDFSKK